MAARPPTTVPAGSAAGAAYVNLRGFGPTRSLTLVNGRRFAIFGPEQVTDLNTIPTALDRAYRSRDRRFLGGVRLRCHHRRRQLHHEGRLRRRESRWTVRFRQLHQHTDLQRRSHASAAISPKASGNAVVSLNYYKREGFTRQRSRRLGGAALRRRLRHRSYLERQPDRHAQRIECRELRGIGRQDGIRVLRQRRHSQRRFTLTPAQLAAGVRLQLAAAGLAGLGANGFTFNDAGPKAASGW